MLYSFRAQLEFVFSLLSCLAEKPTMPNCENGMLLFAILTCLYSNYSFAKLFCIGLFKRSWKDSTRGAVEKMVIDKISPFG